MSVLDSSFGSSKSAASSASSPHSSSNTAMPAAAARQQQDSSLLEFNGLVSKGIFANHMSSHFTHIPFISFFSVQ